VREKACSEGASSLKELAAVGEEEGHHRRPLRGANAPTLLLCVTNAIASTGDSSWCRT
jgi:hypothetical protein